MQQNKKINFINDPRASHAGGRASFTLVELVVVLGILAILTTVAVIVLRPDQLFKQSRDSQRLSDMQTVNQLVSLTQSFGSASLGTANIVYTSLPDNSATCAGYSLPTLPAGWTYSCKTAVNYRRVDGTGWVPVDFTTASTYGAKIASLPVDPTNTATNGLYYTYVTGGSWELTAKLESEDKHDVAINDGGMFPGVYQVGTHLDLTPSLRDLGMIGQWDFEEGAGATVYDTSGSNYSGTWAGTGTHYVAGKVGSYAGQYNGTDDEVRVNYAAPLNLTTNFTTSAWVYIVDNNTHRGFICLSDNSTGYYDFLRSSAEGSNMFFAAPQGAPVWHWDLSGAAWTSFNEWAFVTWVITDANIYFYKNGVLYASSALTYPLKTVVNTSVKFEIGHASGNGWFSGFMKGYMDDVRIYNRALTVSEVMAIYNATK
ncbi:MAG: hypothetical protein PHN74_02170 [Candidatus Pacebacteria bacterium]|nr:hypothetical protein [Candidatus Paceibacterota bacterium]